MRLNTNHSFIWVNLIRMLGSFLVVMAHLQHTASIGTYSSEFYYSLSRIAVPLFFLVSGFLLLSKQENISQFFRKRAAKILLPLIIWSVIYMALRGDFSNSKPVVEQVIMTIIKILRGPRAAHLWFLYSLIGLYFATPVLRLFVVKSNDADLRCFILIWIIATPIGSFLESYFNLKIGIEWHMFAGYIGYFVLGYYLGKIQYANHQLWVAAFLFIVSFGVTWAGIYVARQIDPYVDYFETYLSMNVIVMASSGFVLLKHLRINERWHKFIILQSHASFGVYLIHLMILSRMQAFYPFDLWYSIPSALWVVPALALTGYIISLMVVLVIQKIPLLKSIVP